MSYRAPKPNWPFSLNRDSELASRLVGWWPGAPTGARKSLDLSPSVINGSFSGFASPTSRTSGWIEGKDGGQGGIVFDGVDDCVLPTLAQSNTYYFLHTDPISISLWLKPGTLIGSVGFIVGVRRATDFCGWFSYYDKASSAVYWIFEGGGAGGLHQRLSTASSVPVGSWTNITCTRDATNTMAGTKIYINGVIDAGTTTDTGPPTIPDYTNAILGIGLNPQPSALPYLGVIEDVKIWNRELSATEARKLYDPKTRWSLRWQPSRTARLFKVAPVVASASKLLVYNSSAITAANH